VDCKKKQGGKTDPSEFMTVAQNLVAWFRVKSLLESTKRWL